MPASLRFVLLLLGLGVVAALASGIVQHRQTAAEARSAAEVMTGGSVARGKAAITRHGCGGCHVIPGIAEASGRLGPSLRAFARRSYIAGRLPNDPDNLKLWVRAPQHVLPGTAMPEQPMSQRDAADIAAFLLTERK